MFDKAHIVLRRWQLDPASSDIGFTREAISMYRALISEYNQGIGIDDTWLGRVAQTCKERQPMVVARSMGYRFLARQVVKSPARKYNFGLQSGERVEHGQEDHHR